MDEEVEIIAGLGRVLAQQARSIGFGDRSLQRLGLADELAAYVDVTGPRAHRIAGEKRTFDQLVRIVADDLAVLAGARLGFVGVDDQEIGAPLGRLLGHEAPFHAGREARAAAPAQAGLLHDVDDRVLAERHQRPGVVPIAALLGRLQTPVLETVEIGEDPVLVLKHRTLQLPSPQRRLGSIRSQYGFQLSLE